MSASTVSPPRVMKQRAGCSPAGRVTRSLLGWGVVAGPFYIGISLTQAALRPGFDSTRHGWSLMENGEFGWVQSANLVLTGLMIVAAARGIGRALLLRAVPALLAVFGLGMLGSGFLIADPSDGFPVGTPAGPGAFSWHGIGHLVSGGIGFLAYVAAAVVLGVWFIRRHQRGWGIFSIATGVLYLAAFAGITSGSAGAPVIAFTGAVFLAFGWLAAVCVHLYRHIN